MTKLMVAFLSLVCIGTVRAAPSSANCDYYTELDHQLQCQSSNYLSEADRLCRSYINMAPRMNSQIQEFFPRVRLCLQQELEDLVQAQKLSCENLNHAAVQTHVDCYVRSGYCEFQWRSDMQLLKIMFPRFAHPIWDITAAKIIWACASDKADDATQ